jgi:hypothetical protein
VHISVTFLLITFYWCFFSKLFQRIRNQREILRFIIPILNFWQKFFLLLLPLFVHFDCKCAGNGSKKRKIFLMNASHNSVLQPSKGLHNQVVKIVVPYCTCHSCHSRLSEKFSGRHWLLSEQLFIVGFMNKFS